MGDVFPAEGKVRLLEELARVLPGGLGHAILASSGSDAVEIALKTALVATGKPAVVAFEGAYHGLSLGALDATWREDFRRPFLARLAGQTRFVPWGDAEAARRAAKAGDVGAILFEPVQGRGGLVFPPRGFVADLRRIADETGALLVADEVYTGLGRTGRWLACEHEGVAPDVVALGKALGGGFPLSACVGKPEVMAHWPVSHGEALRTSTHLGNPLGCAAGLAVLRVLERDGLVRRADELGARWLARLGKRLAGNPRVRALRGRGLLVARRAGRRGVRARAVEPAPAGRLDRAGRGAGSAHARADSAARDRRGAARRGRGSPGGARAVTRAEIEREVLAWIAEGVDAPASDARFDALALALFRLQYAGGAAYRRLCAAFGCDDPERVKHWREIPAVPTGAFKEARLAIFPASATVRTFRTSGSTTEARGQLELDDLALYDASLEATFRALHRSRRRADPLRGARAARGRRARLVALVHVLARGRDDGDARRAASWSAPAAGSRTTAIAELAGAREPLVLCGTAFAFVHLLDRLEARGEKLALPAGTRVMETGGFKGRSRELSRDELHGGIEARLGVPRARIVNQYGMCELASQFYEPSLRPAARPT